MFSAEEPVEITIDRIDRKILRLLQEEGRLSNVATARRVGLSPTACSERIRKLEKEGVIEGYHARINPAKLGANLMVFVEITLTRTSSDSFAEFSDAVQKTPEILECHLVAGDFDFLIKARVPDMPSYRKLLGETLLMMPGVNESRTYVVMEEVKNENKVLIKG
ncbi:leucine-responsive transcriptional regulator Lrp [Pseudidiomarina terrestris]|uniref:Leucine-responsive regulatory protein n=1 Tax=Pseudidiomarina terrestris TaxID=2820060 RepID=A0AAW7QZK1_9GAMM|nr:MULTISPECIES: leucine-responsive transcriptional regulator Lrp [unclassified Pseudidiomarina]MDN7123739.1 leucine-responsive transcriptional regulator Lrp [Pseudidiomarina sp. 1APP75-32.1]MDN7126447.1 leucine-responsive transcriptional regulator Lrp [Pseudidiomarina sp. 1APR75-33.1]MDN7128537.1 leucine-responsive transcriptional regulator Lrp [Pseudidiomarina sp. 1APR75-15]MDN7135205.1 leucine-responsive transcriptional regulator Lrp [Pseudidiomarina sp. 1ASP75-5]MDN7137877.1 leucine-respon